LIAGGVEEAIFEGWYVDFVADCAAVATAVNCEGVVWEWHFARRAPVRIVGGVYVFFAGWWGCCLFNEDECEDRRESGL
jgi:hypothetical protein